MRRGPAKVMAANNSGGLTLGESSGWFKELEEGMAIGPESPAQKLKT